METVNKWYQKYRDTGDISNKPLNRSFKKIDPEKLESFVNRYPDSYLSEIAEEFSCSNATIHKALKRLGITRKKTKLFKEQNPKEVSRYFIELGDAWRRCTITIEPPTTKAIEKVSLISSSNAPALKHSTKWNLIATPLKHIDPSALSFFYQETFLIS